MCVLEHLNWLTLIRAWEVDCKVALNGIMCTSFCVLGSCRVLFRVRVQVKRKCWRGGRRERRSGTARSAAVLNQTGHITAGRKLGWG